MPATPTPPVKPATAATVPTSAAIPGDLVPMTQMRKIIAQRMIESRRTSAHVHCMFEVDITRIVQIRNKNKSGFEKRNGVRLTFMPFFARAVMITLQQFPIVNASIEGDGIRYHRHINLGIAVALDWGLIVPVLKNADELNFLGLQRGISDLGERARSKKLKPEEVEGSDFHHHESRSVWGRLRIAHHQSAQLGNFGGWGNYKSSDRYNRREWK